MMLKNNGLSIALISLFALTMGGQAVTGWRTHNADERTHGGAPVTFIDYLGSGHFWEATGENWESEFLQMAMFVLLSTHLYQKGSAESKRLDVCEEQDLDPRDYSHLPDVPGPVKRGGWRLRLYENSLGLALLTVFGIAFAMHAGGGLVEYNEDRQAHHEPAVVLMDYLRSDRFWFESFQNWQSEFLSLAAMVVGTVYLRQRGSAESKAVHAPHAETGKA
jgi:hypothetical protein